MDELAIKLDMDPVELRPRNETREGRKQWAPFFIAPFSGMFDYSEWWKFPPAHFKIAFHFVVSS